MALIDKLTAIANGFRSSRGITNKLSLDEMATLAAEATGGENKLPQVIDRTVTEITANDLGAITKIGIAAFQNCSSLTSVSLPNSVTEIGNGVFSGCSSLTNVSLPASLTQMGINVFYKCVALPNIIIPNSVTSIGSSAFAYCDSLASVTIGNSVESIGYEAFYFCNSLTSVTIPDSVITMGRDTFYNCQRLASLVIGNGLTTIPGNMCFGCYKLANIVIGNSVTEIGGYAFSTCACKSMTIPASVTKIGSNALTNATILTFLSTTPPSISSSSFTSNGLNKIIVPAGCGDVYKNATNWANFADYIEEATE